jgi:hypothetical protein
MVNIANSKDIKTWLRDLYRLSPHAEIAMEKQRQVMIRQDLEHVYVGDQVIVDVKHLPLALPSTQTAKLQAKFVEPFKKKLGNIAVYELEFPSHYKGIRQNFHASDRDPGFADDRHPEYLSTSPATPY